MTYKQGETILFTAAASVAISAAVLGIVLMVSLLTNDTARQELPGCPKIETPMLKG